MADCTRWLATPAGAARAAQAGLPQRVHLFALPTLPPLHLALLQQLAHWVDVQVYALNPCAEYWFDVVDAKRLARLALQGKAQHSEVGHPLLASWGAQAQATLGQLVDAAGDSVVDDERHAEPDGHHLLAQLQSALLHLQPMAPGSVTLAPDDRSIELHGCHGRLRELEVLQDRLLALMAGPNPPRPEDILVVTPDLEATAPLVDAVFGTAPPERSLPYRLTGLAASQASAPARALLDALALAAGRLEASAVMALLQQPVVARRFGLDEAALALVHGWLREAGVHW
ncbi:MAG: exodeoxyribonuclease V subunit gamma, partial [Burkholderiales bacterium PBB5]